MILINGNWEIVKTAADCIKLIQVHMGLEFASAAKDILLPSAPEKIGEALREIGDVISNAENAREMLMDLIQ